MFSSIAVLFGNNTFWLFRLDEDALLFEESRFNLYPINSQDVITSLNFLSSDCLLALTESGSSLLYKITCSSTPSIESIQARALPPPLGLNQAVCVNDTLSILRYIDDSTYNVFSMRIVEPMDSIVQSIKRRQLEEALELAAFAGISECDVYKEVCRVWLLEQKEQERSFAYVLERITDDSFVVCFALELGISVSFAINEQLVLLNDALNRILRQAKRDYTSYIKTCALLLKQRKLLCMQKTVQAISAKSMVARFGTHSPSRNRDLESMLDNVTGVEETFGPGVDSCSEFELFARCLSSMMGDVADSDLCVMGSDGWEHHVGRLLQSAHPFEILSSFIRLEWPQDFMVNLQIYAPLVGTVLFPLDVFHQLLAFQPRALNPNVYLPLLDKIFLDRQLLSWTSLHVEALNVVSERASDWLEGVEDWPADMQMQKCCFSRKVFQSLSMQPAAQYFDLLLRLAGALLEAGLEVWCLTVLGHILDVVHHNCEEHAGSQLSDIQEWTTLLGDYCTLLSKGAIPSAISFVSWTFEGKTDLIVVPIVQAIMEQLRACSCIESDAVFQLKALRNARVERHASRSLRRFLGLQLRLEWEEVALGVEHFEEAIISSILSSIDHNVHEHLVLIATLVQDWMDFAQVGSENSGPVFGSVRGILSLLVLGCLVFDDVLLAAKIVLPIFDQLEEVAEECSLRSDQNLTLLESALTLRSILLAGCVLRHYRIPSLRFVLIAKFWTNSLGQLLDPSIAMLKSIQRSLQNPSKLVMESYKRKLARSSKFIARQLFELLNLNKSNSRVLEWSAHNAISLTDGADGDDDKRIINEIGDNLTLLELIVLQMSASFVEDNKIATVSSFLPLMTMSDHVVIVSRNLLRCKQSLADSDAPKFMAYSLLISIAATCKLDTLRNLLLRFQFGIELDGDQQAENNALAQLCDNLLSIGADKEIVRRAMHYNLRGRLFGSSSLSLEEIDLFESCLDMLNAAGCDEYWNRLIARDLSILKLFRFLQQHRVPFTPHHLNLLDPVGLNGFVLTSASNILNLISGGLRNVNPSECRESVLGYVMMMSRCAIDTSDMVAAEIEILGSLITNAIRVESVDMAYVLSCILLNEYNIDEFRAFDSVFRVIALAISFLHEQNLELLARMNARESSTVVAAHEEQFALWERLCSLYVSKCAAGHLETLMGKLTAYRRLEWSDGGNEGLDLINRGVSIILEALQSSSDEGCYSSVDLHDLQYYHHEALCYFIQSSVFNMGDMNPLESARAKLLKLESELRQQLELDGAGAVESQCVRVDENVNSPSIPANQRSEILKRLAKRGYDEIIAKQSLSLALRNVQSFSLDSIFEKALLHAIELSSSTVFDLPVIDSSNNQPIFALSSSNAIAKRLRLEQCSQLVVSLEQSVEALLGGECNAQSAEAPVACDECIAQVLDAVATGDGDSAAPGVAPSGVNDEVLDAWSDDDLDAALEDSESGGLDAVIHDDPVEPDEVQPPQVQSDFPFSSGSKEYALYALLQDINDYLEISLPGESLASQLVVFELESQVDCRGDCLSIMCKVFELLELDLERVDDEDAFDFLVDHVVPGLMLVPKILEALSRKIALERFPTSKDQDPTLVSVVAPFLRSGGTLVAAEDLLFLLSAWRLDVIGQGHNNHAALSRRPLELMLSDPPR